MGSPISSLRSSITALASEALEEVVVTGIRGSLSQSAEIKHASNLILDSITSEDLGKFPDSNVAESLQRIPGVSIDREGGEGRFVTVRGFGPEFNTVLLNGRSFASDNEGREFSFDLLAAELISGADVYKSAVASLPDGGIGATVNIRTPRPLELGSSKAIVSGKALYEDLSEEITPQGFALLSDVFADGKLGLLGAVSYQRRESLINFTQNNGYLPRSTVGPTNAPLYTNVFAPRNLDVGQETQDRERRGVNVTAQYRPADEFTLTLDGLYSKFDVESRVQSLGSISVETDPNITCLYCGYPTLADPGLLRPLGLGSFLGGGGTVPRDFRHTIRKPILPFSKARNQRPYSMQPGVTSEQGGDPVYRRTYEQLDLRLSFMVTDQIQTFLEGTNVLGAENITTGRFDNQVLGFDDTGARWALGMRANF